MGTLLSTEELKEHALRFLKSKSLMVLGTSSNDKVWSATVYYVVTEEFEIIFYSRSDTRHTENIEINPNISVVVTEIPIKSKKIKSIQLAGIARKADGADWNKYYLRYEEKYKWAKEFPDHIIYVVKPLELWMIDEKLLGHFNRVQVF